MNESETTTKYCGCGCGGGSNSDDGSGGGGEQQVVVTHTLIHTYTYTHAHTPHTHALPESDMITINRPVASIVAAADECIQFLITGRRNSGKQDGTPSAGWSGIARLVAKIFRRDFSKGLCRWPVTRTAAPLHKRRARR